MKISNETLQKIELIRRFRVYDEIDTFVNNEDLYWDSPDESLWDRKRNRLARLENWLDKLQTILTERGVELLDPEEQPELWEIIN